MGVTLKKVVENINTLSNKQNSEIIIKYLNYLIEKGNSINSQIAYLKAVYYYAKYLEKVLRAYVNVVGDKAVYRLESTITPNKAISTALKDIRNDTDLTKDFSLKDGT